ncbi:hypothetical protein TNCV_3091301 [Trichonephila clavipes]|uniref:Uncharacterized protein n=1 Tax=Trichonephila clavipes TaxID=2585209 RepID=A0A8X6W8H6_TRICX|nr:hypothetical protein TNCV_3091301 [Trichonephila clavipes]
MATVLWNWRGVFLVDFMPQETTINSGADCETVQKFPEEHCKTNGAACCEKVFSSSMHLIPSATFRRFINSKASRRSCIIMPPKRRAIGRSTPQARKRRALRTSESDEQRALRLENLRVHATETRSSESSDQQEVRLETNRIRTNQIRSLRQLNYGKKKAAKCSNKHCSIKTNTAR